MFLGLVALGVGLVVAAYVTTEIPEAGDLPRAQNTTVYFSDGTTEMGTFSVQNRVIIEDSQIPDHVKHAVVAAEDRSFYENAGVSPTGMARALWNNLRGGSTQGGSTITQQYAERYYVGTTTTDYVGKFKEALLAIKLGQSEDKDTILANYLNTIFFGRGSYGIQTAAQSYFGVDAADLTLTQAALLAGVIPSPNNFDPRVSPEAAERRWNYVLDGMVSEGWITQEERSAQVFPETIPYVRADTQGGPKGYLLAMVKSEILAKKVLTEEELESRGLTIVTTVDTALQDAMVAAVQTTPEDASPALRTGMVSIDPSGGEIRALYGGADYVAEQFNAVTQARAQAGSTYKPFALVAALEKGVTLDTRYDGRSGRVIEGYGADPLANFGNKSYGRITLAEATANSVNTVYAELNVEVGPAATQDVALRAGIPEGDIGDNPGNVLGSSSPHPLDVAAAYSTFAAQGMRSTPHIVQAITELDGSPVYDGSTVPERVFEADVMAEATYALTRVVEEGSGAPARDLKRPVAGKTGTSNENRSAWFVGYTPQLVTAVALFQPGAAGEDPITPFGGYREITGGSWPVTLWTTYMRQALDGMEVEQFPARPEPEPDPTTAEPTPTETTPEPTDAPTTPDMVQVAVPAGLVGRGEQAARTALSQAGLQAVVRQEPNAAAAGTVLRVEPEEGAQVPAGSSIVLVVSGGPATPSPTPTTPPPSPTVVPDAVVPQAARDLLEGDGRAGGRPRAD